MHGRNKGRPLRAHQADLIRELLPRLDIDPASLPAKLCNTLFGRSVNETWLEIGFGGGEHLAWQAMANRDVGIIGCEPFINGVAKLLRAIEAEKLDNVRIFNGDARELLESLGGQTIARAFLLYPDPWPKKRHHKRRFVNQWSLSELHRVMMPGSQLRIASDIPDYIEWTLREIRLFGGFTWAAQTRGDWSKRSEDWPGTRYEQKALREKRSPAYLTFLRSE